MTEEILLDELNELCENWLCPMDLMDSIDDYTNEKIIDELCLRHPNYFESYGFFS